MKNLQNYFSEKFISLVNLLSSEQLQDPQLSKNDKLNSLRDFIECRIPSKKNLKEVPKLYLQLFSNETKPNPFFSNFISDQVKNILIAISNKEETSENLIVLSGETKSGKSFIINKVIKTLNKSNCYQIVTPMRFIKNPTESKLFKHLHHFNEDSTSLKSFEDLESNSVVFLNNFELWWRKNNNGLVMIEKWIEIFSKYKMKITFVIELNTVLKNILAKINEFDKLVLKYVTTPAISLKQLGKMVDYKNKLAGLDIYYKGRKFKFSNSLKSSLYFRNIHVFVKGNIGWFNNIWMGSLMKNQDGLIEFKNNFNKILPNIFSDQELLILVHFYYHKKINIKNLSEYFNENIHLNINENISNLKTEKVLVTNNNFTEINPFISRDLITVFKEKN